MATTSRTDTLLAPGETIASAFSVEVNDSNVEAQIQTACYNALVCISVAESALQKATGSNFPPPECWGCTGHPVYNAERHHLYMRCPNKHDPEVKANGAKGVRDFIARRRTRSLPPEARGFTATAKDANWEANGHPSSQLCQLVHTISNPSTTPIARKACYAQIRQNKRSSPSGSALVAAAKVTKTSNDTFFACPITLHSLTPEYISSVMNIIRKRLDAALGISQLLPFMCLPIGDGSQEGAGILKGMCDTGAGLCLGLLAYHLHIWETRPDLVHQFAYLADVDDLDPFAIGGVGVKGESPMITAVITYKLPFKVNGKRALVSIGLSADAACNTIFGLPFFKSTNGAMLLGSDTIILQKFGVTFPLSYEVPQRSTRVLNNSSVNVYHSTSCYATPVAISAAIDVVTGTLESLNAATSDDQRVTFADEVDTPDAMRLDPSTSHLHGNGPELRRDVHLSAEDDQEIRWQDGS